jgi:hypothetical protein
MYFIKVIGRTVSRNNFLYFISPLHVSALAGNLQTDAGSPKPASKPGSLYAAVILLASALEGRMLWQICHWAKGP